MMDIVLDILQRAATAAPFAIASMFLAGGLIWRLRRLGYWSALAASVLEMVLLVALRFVWPHGASEPRGETSPAELGIVVGCGLPMIATLLHHQRLEKQR